MNLSLEMCKLFFRVPPDPPGVQRSHHTQNTVGNTVAYMIVFEKYNYYYKNT